MGYFLSTSEYNVNRFFVIVSALALIVSHHSRALPPPRAPFPLCILDRCHLRRANCPRPRCSVLQVLSALGLNAGGSTGHMVRR